MELGGIRLYVDGELKATGTLSDTAPIVTEKVRLGWRVTPDDYLVGYIALARAYNVILSDVEIRDITEATKPLYS